MEQVEDICICVAIFACIIAAVAIAWDVVDAYKTRH